MTKEKNAELLDNKEVVEEINRHRWIESEKAGADIAFEAAARDWLNRFSDGWRAYHRPEVKVAPKRSAKKFAKK